MSSVANNVTLCIVKRDNLDQPTMSSSSLCSPLECDQAGGSNFKKGFNSISLCLFLAKNHKLGSYPVKKPQQDQFEVLIIDRWIVNSVLLLNCNGDKVVIL